MDVGHVLAAHFEFAQCYSWKRHVTVLGPVDIVGHLADDVGSERDVFGRQDRIQSEQLTNDVGNVKDFRDEEQNQQIETGSVRIIRKQQ